VSVWEEIRDLIRVRDERALADRVIALDPAERAEVAARLPGFVDELRVEAAQAAYRDWADRVRRDRDDTPEWVLDEILIDRWRPDDVLQEYETSLLIAGAGTIARPAQAAAWLARGGLASQWAPQPRLDHLMRVLATRPREWQADVAVRLARRIRTPQDRIVPLALELLRVSGTEPPAHDPLVIAWLSSGVGPDDPLIDTLLPRLFETEGVGRALRNEWAARLWLDLIRHVLFTGRMSRERLLDACVRRFLRGGAEADLRFFAQVHEAIDPTPQEVAARRRDYLRLLPAAPTPVAESALRRVRGAGPIDDADAVEAIVALAFRAEAGLARAGLTWLEERVRLAPGTAAELAEALAAAFGHPSHRVQERAARIALRHADAFAPATEVIAEAVPLLLADLGAQVAARFGGEPVPAETAPPFTPPPLPAVAPPGPHPAPTLDVPDYLLSDPVHAEAWLAAFVARAATDREGLRAEPAGRFGEPHTHIYGQERWLDPGDWLRALALEVVTPGRDPGPPEPPRVDPQEAWEHASFSVHVGVLTGDEAAEMGLEDETADGDGGDASAPAFPGLPEPIREEIFRQALEAGVSAERVAAWREGRPAPPVGPDEPQIGVSILAFGHGPFFDDPEPPDPVAEDHRRRRLPNPAEVAPPHLFLLYRLEELYAALREGTLPPVLLATPTLATGQLDPGVLVDRLEACAAAGAEPLRADLCQALLRLPRGRHPEAAARAARIGSAAASAVAGWLAEGGLPDPDTGVRWLHYEGTAEHLVEEPERGHEESARLVPVLRAKPTGHDLIDGVLQEPRRHAYYHETRLDWWPSLLPSHREVVAVNYLSFLDREPGVSVRDLELLLAADGPAGDATATLLAHFLAVEAPGMVPLLLAAAARGDLPAEPLGRRLAVFLRSPWRRPRAVFNVLADAARQGAHREVWRILAGLLPGFLPAPGERPAPAHTEAVSLAAEVAAWAGARGRIPVVAAHAASGRRSRFARECIRLHERLTATAPADR